MNHYKVRMYPSGQMKEITVDDWLPWQVGRGNAFADSNGPELWVILAEKAFLARFFLLSQWVGPLTALHTGLCKAPWILCSNCRRTLLSFCLTVNRRTISGRVCAQRAGSVEAVLRRAEQRMAGNSWG